MIAQAILITGFSGLIAQTVFLRELLIGYLGNELTLGIILSVWLASEATGVFVIGKLVDKAANKTAVFVILEIIFSVSFPACIYFARAFKSIFGLAAIEAVSLPLIFFSSFLTIFPAAFCHAGLFSCGCKIFDLNKQQARDDQAASIAKVYAWEITGTIIAGLILTYVLLARFNSFQIAFIVSLFSLLANIPLLNPPRLKILRYFNLWLSGVFIYFILSGASHNLQNLSIDKQFGTAGVIDYRNSVYGNIAVVKEEGQHTFFYNGMPTIVTPLPDTAFMEEFGNLPLLMQGSPEHILIIGSGAGGLIQEMLKYPVKKIDYLELDPLIITMLKKYPTPQTLKELNDIRVKIINRDGRIFLREAAKRYDLMLIGTSNPHDLSTNRFFTADFFSLAEKKLTPQGIVSFCLPGSLTYLSSEMKNLNAGILNAAKAAFSYVRVLPGDYNMFFASGSPKIMGVTAADISSRIDALGVKTRLLVSDYIKYRMDIRWEEWFNQQIETATNKVNRDSQPFAVFAWLALWNKQFSSSTAAFLNYLSGVGLNILLLMIAVIALPFLALAFLRRSKPTTLETTYAITTTGFFGMLISLIIIFIFQIRYGSIYREIGILISLFMAGSTAGSITAMRLVNKAARRQVINLLVKAESAIVIFILLIAAINSFLRYWQFAYPALLILSFAAGLFTGIEFPLAGKIYVIHKKGLGQASGSLYFADLCGGCVAGILGGVFLLPVIGIFGTCLILAFLKLTSLTILIIANR